MSYQRGNFSRALLWLAITGACLSPIVHADEQATVGQLIGAGKLSDARARVEQYLQAKPNDPQMRLLKGVILNAQGKSSDAMAVFARLTETNPEMPEAYNNLAVLYAEQHQFEKARSMLESALKTNGSYAAAYKNLTDVNASLANQAYSRALGLDSGRRADPAVRLALLPEASSGFVIAKLPPSTNTPMMASASDARSNPAFTNALSAATTPPPVLPAAPAVLVAANDKKIVLGKVQPATPVAAGTPGAFDAASASRSSTNSAAAPQSQPPAPQPDAANDFDAKRVESSVRNWARAWASKDLGGYFSAYSHGFSGGHGSHSGWEQDRRVRIEGKSSIHVGISNLSISGKGDRATARFTQNYSADGLDVSSRKTLDLAREGNKWVIVRETVGG